MSEFDIKYLKGIGEVRARLLESECDIRTLRDLLYYFPSRHIDRSRFYTIAQFSGEMPSVQVRGHFISFTYEGEGAKKRLKGVFNDGRNLMECVWFSGHKYITSNYRTGVEYVIFGKPVYFRGAYSMAHPEIELFNPTRPPEGFRGVYPLTELLRKRNITQKVIQTMITSALESKPFSTWPETIPAEIVDRLRLFPLRRALAAMHFPTTHQELQKARERMKFEELFYLELHILRYSRRRNVANAGFIFGRIGDKFNTFYNKILPFPLTGAQKRVLREIREDMRYGRQMNRLLQGDVGCGKTMVGFMSMLMAIDNGFQAALMAPTEILASQHFESLKPWCDALGLGIALLTGSTGTKARRDIDIRLRDGSLQILVGTHALLEEKVVFNRLGLAIIDEQHRFGVAQRARMWGKGSTPPHVLVMTATPIPRTLAMTVYGDLEVSVIDELPPGRKPVLTLLRYDETRTEVDRLVMHELRAGHQVYIVYPLIHENDKLELKSLEANIDYIREKYRGFKVCHVHGQMKPADKDAQMQRFVTGEAHIMVATTVIEVGVNVPNASVMIIENAERFGLSQLHQLRGRVGRGADKAYCILMSKYKIAAETRKRLTVMTETTDGFLVSEADMQMRGPGDMEGTQQSGIAFNLKVSNLATDGQLIQLARETASAVLDSNPALAAIEQPASSSLLILSAESQDMIRREMDMRFANRIDWSRIS